MRVRVDRAVQREHDIGTAVDEPIARGGRARAVPAGTAYVDVGTLNGYREAITLPASNAAIAPRAAASWPAP
jgi:glucose-1-phosphate thymidylyltransferase